MSIINWSYCGLTIITFQFKILGIWLSRGIAMLFSNSEQLLNIRKFIICGISYNLYNYFSIKYSCLNEISNLKNATFFQENFLYLSSSIILKFVMGIRGSFNWKNKIVWIKYKMAIWRASWLLSNFPIKKYFTNVSLSIPLLVGGKYLCIRMLEDESGYLKSLILLVHFKLVSRENSKIENLRILPVMKTCSSFWLFYWISSISRHLIT